MSNYFIHYSKNCNIN